MAKGTITTALTIAGGIVLGNLAIKWIERRFNLT